MVDAEIVARRLLVLNDAIQQLSSRANSIDPQRLQSDPLLRAATERWLQVAIEVCVDLAYHLIADRGWKPADSARSAFGRLSEHGVLPAELARDLALAAGLRNVLVHEYTDLDLAIVSRSVHHGLDELRRFGAIIGGLLQQATQDAGS
jgi:uncharacterized protein YutE (UPF0331/DUF86 family)